MIKFSIIVPIYNVERYLCNCLNSLVNQTLKDIEIICIDDGSTDNSFDILKKFALKDIRIKVLRQENQGQGVARNLALNFVNGEYVAFVDPDDFVEENAFELLYNTCKKLNSTILQFNYFEFYENDNNYVLKSFLKCNKEAFIKISGKEYYYSSEYLKNNLFKATLSVWDKVYSSKFIRENSILFSPNKHIEDNLFSIMSIFNTQRIDYLDEILYFYRLRKDSSVNVISDDNLCVIYNLIQIKSFLEKNSDFIKYQKSFNKYLVKTLANHFSKLSNKAKKEYIFLSKDLLNKKDFKKFLCLTSGYNSIFEKIFSIKNFRGNGFKQKVLTILGLKINLKGVYS